MNQLYENTVYAMCEHQMRRPACVSYNSRISAFVVHVFSDQGARNYNASLKGTYQSSKSSKIWKKMVPRAKHIIFLW